MGRFSTQVESISTHVESIRPAVTLLASDLVEVGLDDVLDSAGYSWSLFLINRPVLGSLKRFLWPLPRGIGTADSSNRGLVSINGSFSTYVD